MRYPWVGLSIFGVWIAIAVILAVNENIDASFLFKKETGREIKDIFEEIEEKPLAVASFGQVYKARLKGEKVVIKILKQGVETYIRADMIVLKFLALILDSFGLLRAITVKEIIRQLEN